MKKCYATIYVWLHDMDHNIDLNYRRKIRPMAGFAWFESKMCQIGLFDFWFFFGSRGLILKKKILFTLPKICFHFQNVVNSLLTYTHTCKLVDHIMLLPILHHNYKCLVCFYISHADNQTKLCTFCNSNQSNLQNI